MIIIIIKKIQINKENVNDKNFSNTTGPILQLLLKKSTTKEENNNFFKELNNIKNWKIYLIYKDKNKSRL